jgi:hypothetical protein
MAQLQDDWEHAVALYEESLVIFRAVGDKALTALGPHNLGGAALHQGDALRAAACFAEGLALSREIGSRLGSRYGIAMNLAGMAGVAAAQGQPDRSARLFGATDALFDDPAFGSPLRQAQDVASTSSGTAVRYLLLCFGFCALRAKKRTTDKMRSTMLPFVLSLSKGRLKGVCVRHCVSPVT